MHTSRSSVSRMLVMALVAGLTLTGCDRDDPRGDALMKASVQLSSLNLSGSGTASVEQKSQTLNQVISLLRPIASEGSAAERGSAGLLLCKAYVGLAESASAEAGSAQRAVVDESLKLRSLLSQWLAQNAQADALDAYDPASEFADLKAQSEELAKQRQATMDKKAAIEAKVKGLLDQAAERDVQLKAKREEEVGIRAQIAGLAATAAESLVKEAARIRREGDAFELEKATFESLAAQQRPEIDEVDRSITMIESQQQLLVKSGEQVTQRADTAQADAKKLREQLTSVRQEIEATVASITAVRGEKVDPAYAKAVEQYTAAIAAARSAQESSRAQASSAIAGAQQSLGDVQWAQAQHLATVQSVMTALANASPALPGASSYKQAADQAEPQRTEALTAAAEAYKGTMELLDAMGGKGEAIERQRAHVKQRLAEARFVLSNGADDVRAETRDATKDHPLDSTSRPGASSGSTGSAAGGDLESGGAVVGDLSTPQGTIATYIDASQRMDLVAIAELLVDGDVKDIVMMSAAPSMKLDAAMKAKTGQTLTEAVLADPALSALAGSNPGMPLPAGVTLAEFKFDVQGEKSTVSHPKVIKPITLVNVAGGWRVDPNLPPAIKSQMAMMKPMMASLGVAFDAVTARVEAGELTTAQQVMQAIQQESMKAMMGGGGGGGGRGGSGGG